MTDPLNNGNVGDCSHRPAGDTLGPQLGDQSVRDDGKYDPVARRRRSAPSDPETLLTQEVSQALQRIKSMKAPSSSWSKSVRMMRIACPLALVAAVFLAYFAFDRGSYKMMAVDAFCAGVTAVLTWVQWCWFKP